MEFKPSDINKAIARITEKLDRQRSALETTEAELKLWQDLLARQKTPK